ncbi:MAG: ABC transporter ATP-binding protein [Bacillota bacterium]
MSGLILVKDVHKHVKSGQERINVLRGISLAVEAGESLAIMGPSGSGKSTLLALLGGLDRPTSGVVEIGGERISEWTERQLLRWRRASLGFVFQSFHLMRALSALENVALPLQAAGRPDAAARAAEALKELGLGHRLHHYPAQLSGGEQQRVAIARAFVASPPLMLADEPTGNLDARTGSEILALMLQKARELGSTLVMVTHDPAVAAQCDRTLYLRDGQVEERGVGRGAG